MSDFKDLADRGKGDFQADADGPDLYEYNARRIRDVVHIPTELLAADTPTYVVWQAPKAGRIVSAGILPITVVTLDATDFATIALGTGTAGSMTSIDSFSSEAVTWAALVLKAFTIVQTDTMAEGDVMTLTVTKAASGVLIPQMAFIIDFEKD